MVNLIILCMSVLIFALSARGLGASLISKRHVFPFLTPYNGAALKLERVYRLLAYGFLTVLSFASMAMGFYQSLVGSPF